MTIYRYHFVVPVKGCLYVDRPFAPLPQYNQPGGREGVLANVPRNCSTPPVFVPWTNIAYVEELK